MSKYSVLGFITRAKKLFWHAAVACLMALGFVPFVIYLLFFAKKENVLGVIGRIGGDGRGDRYKEKGKIIVTDKKSEKMLVLTSDELKWLGQEIGRRLRALDLLLDGLTEQEVKEAKAKVVDDCMKTLFKRREK